MWQFSYLLLGSFPEMLKLINEVEAKQYVYLDQVVWE